MKIKRFFAAGLFTVIYAVLTATIFVSASDAESMVLLLYTRTSTTDVSVGIHMNGNTVDRIEYSNVPINASYYSVGVADGNGITFSRRREKRR
jgi:hypothetical protein